MQVVQRICEIQIRKVLFGDLRNSVVTFRSFQYECDAKLAAAAELVASMPALKALMTTRDKATIQDGSEEIWRLADSDLFVLTDDSGKVVAIHSSSPTVDTQARRVLLSEFPQRPDKSAWSLIAGRLFETVSRPIYFGPASQSHSLGTLIVGYEINDKVTKSVADIAASQVAFQYGQNIVASTLPLIETKRIPALMQEITSNEHVFSEVRIDGERFLAASLALEDSPIPVRLIVLKSLDQATQFVTEVSRIVIAMSLLAILIGCGLVLLISHRFTKPLDDLLEGVRALEQGNFEYAPVGGSNDEFGELTTSFNKMRSSLAAAEEKVREAERSATIGRMASSISHDLRHRLTAVLANSEFLAETGLRPERKQELYENVRCAVRKMTDLLESLVEFSRTPESLRLEFVSVQEIVDDSIAAIRLHPQFQNVDIRIESPHMVEGRFDARRLERGLYNLLLNSCEMVPSPSGWVQISIRRVTEKVEIRVTDNGPGVAECIRKSLFQPFVSYAKSHGSGLGLAIAQKACLDHSGTLLLEDASPGLTTFLMELPLAAPFNLGELDDGFAELVHGASYGS